MLPRARRHHRMRRMESTRRGHTHDLALGVAKHLLVGVECADSKRVRRSIGALGDDIAHRRKLEARRRCNRVKVIATDTPAPNEGDPERGACHQAAPAAVRTKPASATYRLPHAAQVSSPSPLARRTPHAQTAPTT